MHLILNEKSTYANASNELGIKLSTSKLIVKRFKETGTFFDPHKHHETDTLIQDRTPNQMEEEQEPSWPIFNGNKYVQIAQAQMEMMMQQQCLRLPLLAISRP